MMGLLHDAYSALVRDFTEQEDKKILFSMWFEEQSARAKKSGYTIDESVMRFIFDVWTHGGVGEHSSEVIRQLFHDGYCYYFALILKDAFPGGYMAWAKPYGHICYIYNDIPYDIEGVYFGEGETVDYHELGDTMEGYRHRGKDDELRHKMEEFAEEHGIDFDVLCQTIYDLVPEDRRVEGYMQGTAMLYFRRYKDQI